MQNHMKISHLSLHAVSLQQSEKQELFSNVAPATPLGTFVMYKYYL